MYDLKDPFVSYFIGLFQTDGHHYETTRNRGSISLEISIKDKDIINKIANRLDVGYSIKTRSRITNFTNGKKVESISLRIFNINFRKWIKKYVPTGNKSFIIKPPEEDFSIFDYWRGVIDGDGSLGTAKSLNGAPFLSIVTASEKMAMSYKKFISNYIKYDKKIKRNKRDNIYGISLFREECQNVIKDIYYKNCLCLNRKKQKAKEALKWVRPKNMKKIFKQLWNKSEDIYILNHSISESMEYLKRTDCSIKMRLWRLSSNQKDV